jgi:hypothetical protein
MLLDSVNIGKSYGFLMGAPSRDQEDFLFHNASYFLFEKLYKACLLKKGKIIVEIYFVIQENQAISLPNSPYGGFFSKGDFSLKAFDTFLSEIISFFKAKGLSKIQIAQAPVFLEKKSEEFNYLLTLKGFHPESILCHQVCLGKEAIQAKSRWLIKKHAERIDFRGYEIKVNEIKNVDLLLQIKNWNTLRGYKIPWSEKKLIKDIKNFPDRYYSISVFHNNEAVGHAVAVHTFPKHLYYFISGIDPVNQYVHTGEFLMTGLFQLASMLDVETLDLGSSQIDDRPNYSLMHFKKRFSNLGLNKWKWVKDLEQ